MTRAWLVDRISLLGWHG